VSFNLQSGISYLSFDGGNLLTVPSAQRPVPRFAPSRSTLALTVVAGRNRRGGLIRK
jgi:hypothetical protein